MCLVCYDWFVLVPKRSRTFFWTVARLFLKSHHPLTLNFGVGFQPLVNHVLVLIVRIVSRIGIEQLSKLFDMITWNVMSYDQKCTEKEEKYKIKNWGEQTMFEYWQLKTMQL